MLFEAQFHSAFWATLSVKGEASILILFADLRNCADIAFNFLPPWAADFMGSSMWSFKAKEKQSTIALALQAGNACEKPSLELTIYEVY